MVVTKKGTALTALFAGILMANAAYSATDGDLGENSEGNLDINLSIGDENGDPGSGSILIQRLSDLNLGEFDASNASALGAGTDFCVYRTGSPDGFDYNIEIASLNGAGNNAFELSSPTTNDIIGYSVFYSGDLGADENSDELAYGNTNPVSASDGVSLSDDGNGAFSCDTDNVSLYVRASVADASVANTAPDYGDTLTLIVTPR